MLWSGLERTEGNSLYYFRTKYLVKELVEGYSDLDVNSEIDIRELLLWGRLELDVTLVEGDLFQDVSGEIDIKLLFWGGLEELELVEGEFVLDVSGEIDIREYKRTAALGRTTKDLRKHPTLYALSNTTWSHNVTSEPSPIARQADRLQGQDCSAGHIRAAPTLDIACLQRKDTKMKECAEIKLSHIFNIDFSLKANAGCENISVLSTAVTAPDKPIEMTSRWLSAAYQRPSQPYT
ncbi:hypothetical protein J6590_086811 [Homalodisca vitripennis]|nr:hypothetical protein J6590_086811 [Homalodisca vitripennis]